MIVSPIFLRQMHRNGFSEHSGGGSWGPNLVFKSSGSSRSMRVCRRRHAPPGSPGDRQRACRSLCLGKAVQPQKASHAMFRRRCGGWGGGWMPPQRHDYVLADLVFLRRRFCLAFFPSSRSALFRDSRLEGMVQRRCREEEDTVRSRKCDTPLLSGRRRHTKGFAKPGPVPYFLGKRHKSEKNEGGGKTRGGKHTIRPLPKNGFGPPHS